MIANLILGFHCVVYLLMCRPLPATIDHFWRMIWQEKVAIIIMLTGLVEQGKPKCER